MRLTLPPGTSLLESLEERLATPLSCRGIPVSRFSSQQEAYSIPLSSPVNSMLIAIFAAWERLRNTDMKELLSQVKEGKYAYSTLGNPQAIKRPIEATEIVKFKSDSLQLDTLPEKEIARYLLSSEAYDDTEFERKPPRHSDHLKEEMYYFHRKEKDLSLLRGIVSEECGSKSILKEDGSLDMSKLNGNPNPAQYRSTIAIVYKRDYELNYHFEGLNARGLSVMKVAV